MDKDPADPKEVPAPDADAQSGEVAEVAEKTQVRSPYQAACVVAHLMGAEQMIHMGWQERRCSEGTIRAEVEGPRAHGGLNAVQLRDTVGRIFEDAQVIIEECLHVKRLHVFIPSFRLHAHLTHGAIEGVISYLPDRPSYEIWCAIAAQGIGLSNQEREAMRQQATKTC